MTFALKFDVILFISGKKSSNGRMLFEICKRVNPKTFFISNVHDVKNEYYKDAKSIGICGATSTPRWLMEAVEEFVLNNK